jgi:hypothetical protein
MLSHDWRIYDVGGARSLVRLASHFAVYLVSLIRLASQRGMQCSQRSINFPALIFTSCLGALLR